MRPVLLVLLLASCAPPSPEPWSRLIPRPAQVEQRAGTYTLPDSAAIAAAAGLEPVAEQLAQSLRAPTGFALPVQSRSAGAAIRLELDSSLEVGDEGYALEVDAAGVRIAARTAEGVFFGTQTLRQLFPARIESRTRQSGPWVLGVGALRDRPRFAWRGLMVDLARHFFDLASLERLVDAMAAFKLNRLHLHLTDDQGWRLELAAYPALTAIGASTSVGGGPGGFLTRSEYSALVKYAQARAVVVVPEIDLPGHTHAALASVPELNCSGVAPPPYTGTAVGQSSLCVGKPETEAFVRAVIAEVAGLTPGPWLHIGGDEAKVTSPSDYATATAIAREAVRAAGKAPVGWEELANADAGGGDVVQHWLSADLAARAAGRGAQLILSPAKRAYLDMQYAPDTPSGIGTFWAGFVSVPAAYDWDPVALLPGVPESAVLGLEGAAWTETIATPEDLEVMIFPRLIGLAELGWSPADGRGIRDYLERLGAQGPRLDAWGVRYFAADEVPWAH